MVVLSKKRHIFYKNCRIDLRVRAGYKINNIEENGLNHKNICFRERMGK